MEAELLRALSDDALYELYEQVCGNRLISETTPEMAQIVDEIDRRIGGAA